MEDDEKANGMPLVWADQDEAMAHNRRAMERLEATIGLSTLGETFMLEELANDCQCRIARL